MSKATPESPVTSKLTAPSTSPTGNPASASSAIYYNSLNQLFTQSGNTQNFTGYLYSGYYQAQHVGTGTVSNLYGLQISYNNTSTGAVSNAVGLRISSANSGGGAITTNYGLLIDDLAGTTAAAIYQSGSNDINYFAGNVGIGTTGPVAKLEVSGGPIRSVYGGSIGNPNIMVCPGTGCPAQGSGIFAPAGNVLAFTTNDVERLRIDSSGNVGIGTTSPGAKLHVYDVSSDIEGKIETDGAGKFARLILSNPEREMLMTNNAVDDLFTIFS